MRPTLWVVSVLLAGGAALAAPSDLQRAEEHFQRGLQAERLSDAAFSTWVQTIRVSPLDVHVDRGVFAMEQFANAARLNPAHWRAQRHLGFAYARQGGTQAHGQLAIVHLVAYMALRPEDSLVTAAKERVDGLLEQFSRRQDWNRAVDEADAVDALRDPATLEAFRGFVAAALEMSSRRLGRLTPVSAASVGSFGEIQDKGVAYHEAMTGIWRSRLDTAGDALAGSQKTLEDTVTRSASYVSNYLYFVGAMHRFTQYLDKRGVAYDPRLPNALIGESVAQLRQLYTRRGGFRIETNRTESTVGNARYRLHSIYYAYIEPDPELIPDEYSRFAELGNLTAADLWTTRDYSRPLPEEYVEAGAVEQPGRDRQAYETVAAATSLAIPRYQDRPEEDWGTWNEARLAAIDTVAFEAEKEWLKWRNVHLWGCARAYGLETADELYLRDYERLGSGEITRWMDVPIGRADLISEADDRAWLVAEAR